MDLLIDIDTGFFGEAEGKVWFNQFQQYIQFSVDDSAELDYVKTCAEYLNNLPEHTIKSLCDASIRYCNDFLSKVGKASKVFNSYKDVLPLISPSILIIPDPEYGDEPVIWMSLKCDWEVEHGMEWVIRKDEVLYVGGFNGTDPWSEISKENSWNFA